MKKLILVAGLLLAGCVSPEELNVALEQQCVEYGFKPGTEAFANCKMQTDHAWAMEENADSLAAAAWSRPQTVNKTVIAPPAMAPVWSYNPN